MRVFISGKITGVDDYLEQFNKAEEMLTAMGGEVMNPAAAMQNMPKNLPHEVYMDMALSMLKHCDCIYMLSGWKDSKGAREEHDFAIKNDIAVLYEDDAENAEFVQNQINILYNMCTEYHELDPRQEALRFAIITLETLIEDALRQ